MSFKLVAKWLFSLIFIANFNSLFLLYLSFQSNFKLENWSRKPETNDRTATNDAINHDENEAGVSVDFRHGCYVRQLDAEVTVVKLRVCFDVSSKLGFIVERCEAGKVENAIHIQMYWHVQVNTLIVILRGKNPGVMKNPDQ